MMHILTLVLSYGAALLHIVAYYLYGRSIIQHKAKPNVVSITIWAVGSFIILFSYNFVAQDWYKESIALVDSIGCLAIFGISLFNGKFSFRDIKPFDLFIFTADILAIVIWYKFGGQIAYYVLQASAFLSIIPMCRQVWADTEKEDSLVWFLWTIAYFLSGIVVLIRWTGSDDIIYQINYTIMHLAIAVVCVVKARKLSSLAAENTIDNITVLPYN